MESLARLRAGDAGRISFGGLRAENKVAEGQRKGSEGA